MNDRPASLPWRTPLVFASVLGWAVCVLWYLVVSDDEPWGGGTLVWLPLLLLSLPGFVAAMFGSAKMLRAAPPVTQDAAWAAATPATLACVVLAGQCAYELADGRLLPAFSGVVMLAALVGAGAMVWAVAPTGRSSAAAPDDVKTAHVPPDEGSVER